MRICIISPRHISYNPRVVKEATALQAAGHAVVVVALSNHHKLAQHDARIMSACRWQLITYDYRRGGAGTLRWLWTALRKRAATWMCRLIPVQWLDARALGREFPELRRLALSVKADLYIAHHADALPAAAAAAARHGTDYAFDAEDFHTGMDGVPVPSVLWIEQPELKACVKHLLTWQDQRPGSWKTRLIWRIEARYLHGCRHITAASAGIAHAYQQRYQLAACPVVVLNTFPSLPEQALAGRGQSEDADQRIKLYWYSQVIGPGRGLEMAAEAMRILPGEFELHLRGELADEGYAANLKVLAGDTGSQKRVIFHKPCPPDDLITNAATYDIGLALETGAEINRLLCITNKILAYVAAGLQVVATSTPAQIALAGSFPDQIQLCALDDPADLAQAVLTLTPKLAGMRIATRNIPSMERPLDWADDEKRLVEIV
jgi:hypothetical protein